MDQGFGGVGVFRRDLHPPRAINQNMTGMTMLKKGDDTGTNFLYPHTLRFICLDRCTALPCAASWRHFSDLWQRDLTQARRA